MGLVAGANDGAGVAAVAVRGNVSLWQGFRQFEECVCVCVCVWGGGEPVCVCAGGILDTSSLLLVAMV